MTQCILTHHNNKGKKQKKKGIRKYSLGFLLFDCEQKLLFGKNKESRNHWRLDKKGRKLQEVFGQK
jgi:hypothetical protein